MQRLQFHSFDAFRFFAFFKVYIFHATAIVVTTNSASLQWVKDHISHGGGIGVSFFFVLSGFLITYILTRDKSDDGRINLPKFFARRAFRIWPLYYAMVILAFALPPDFAKETGFYMNGGGYVPDWRFSFTFLENYKMILVDNVPRTTPLPVFWSLCIEEHFYIAWMLAFFFIRRRWIPVYLVTTILLAILARIFEAPIYGTENITTNDLLTNADYFAISGLLGYYTALQHEKLSAFVQKIPLWARIGYVILLLLVLLNQKALFASPGWFLSIFKHTLFSLLFALLLFIFLPRNSPLKIGDSNVFTRLGKISYGLYVFHIIWIHVVYKFLIDHHIVIDNWTSYLLYVLVTLGGTIVTSVISYRFFEVPVLRLREKWFPVRKE